jgi:hypothetical protein
MKIRTAVFLVLLLGCLANAWADGVSSASSAASTNGGKGFGLGMEFGSVTIDGTNFNTIRLQPDLDLGIFGVGLDLNFEFDGYGNFRTTEWNSWQAIVSKVKYLRYGRKNELLYLKVGSISDFVLGNGMIVNGYNNALNEPAMRKLGLAWDMDFKYAGFQTMVGNLLALDVMGVRAYARPFVDLKIPFIDKIEIGGTVAIDRDPQNPVPPASDPYHYLINSTNAGTNVLIWGADITAPFLTTPIFSLKSYLDFAAIAGKGVGEVLGFSGRIITFIPYKLEIKNLQKQFTPGYFDIYYDINRATKYDSLNGFTNIVFGGLFQSGVSMFNDMLSFLVTIDMPDMTFVQKPVMTATAKMDRALFQKVDFSLSLIQREITTFGDVFSFMSTNSAANVNTVFLINFTYYISENVAMTLNYQRSFQMDSSGSVQPFSSTVFNTKISF